MWWRFLTFCVLVSLTLFVVLSCIHGRPVIHLFFHRCCEEDIENDQVIFENFGNNFLRERLVGADIVIDDNESFASEFEVEEVIKHMREKFNVHDPESRIYLEFANDTSETKSNVKNVSNTGEFIKTDFKNGEKVNITQSNINLEANEMTTEVINDVSSESRELVEEGKLSSNNDVVSDLDSDETIEATTENTKAPSPIKLVQVKESFNNTDIESSKESSSSMGVQKSAVIRR